MRVPCAVARFITVSAEARFASASIRLVLCVATLGAGLTSAGWMMADGKAVMALPSATVNSEEQVCFYPIVNKRDSTIHGLKYVRECLRVDLE